MDLHLTTKVALITGANRGLGRAIAIRLAAERMRVALAARDEAKLNETADAIRAAGGEAFVHVADLSTVDAPAAFAQASLAHFGRIDGGQTRTL